MSVRSHAGPFRPREGLAAEMAEAAIDLSVPCSGGQWPLRALEDIVVSHPTPPAAQLAVYSDEFEGRPPVGAGE